MQGLLYILQSMFDLYLMTFVLRLGMQWVRADYRNPIVQFVLTVTNPLVLPVSKIVPRVGNLDLATLLIFLLLHWAVLVVLTWLAGVMPTNVLALLSYALLAGLRQIITVYNWIIIIYVLMGWVAMGGGYNPSLAMVSSLLKELAEPLLAPFRRIIPAIAGWDLSPIVVILLLQGLTVALR